MGDPARPVGTQPVAKIMAQKLHPASGLFGMERDGNPGIRLIRQFPGHAEPARQIRLDNDASGDAPLTVVDGEGSARGHIHFIGLAQPPGKGLPVLEPSPDGFHGGGKNQEVARTSLSVAMEVSGMGPNRAR